MYILKSKVKANLSYPNAIVKFENIKENSKIF